MTLQGLEWMPDGVFHNTLNLFRRIKQIQAAYPGALMDVIEATFDPYDYVAIFIPDVDST